MKSLAQVFWLRKGLSSAFLDFKYGDFILYILPFMSLTQGNIPMPFGIHTDGFFTENVSALKKDNLACGDTCLASHILPILIFPHLFFLSVYSSYNIHHCLNRLFVYCSLDMPCWASSSMCLLAWYATTFILSSLNTKNETFWWTLPPNTFAPKWALFPQFHTNSQLITLCQLLPAFSHLETFSINLSQVSHL